MLRISTRFKDYITERTGGKIPPNLAAHLNREFFHAQWVVILDDELLKAIVEGVVIECSDGVLRRFFIRIITYSADYPEKVLIATIKSRSDCPCVRCLVHKSDLHKMGTNEDFAFRKAHPRVDDQSRREEVARARSAIASGLAVGGDPVMRLLSHSGVPTTNAFSERLSSTGFNIFSKLVNDVLHEFEIGAFKALLLHLIRVLDASAAGHAFVHELDKRFRATPTFNQTIRRFSSNVSQLRRRAARDYEDILQCAIPAFHGFLPGPLGELVTKLLYINARWHALAKLRMQTEATIILLEDATSQMGDQYRSFMEAVDEVETLETPAEAEKRLRVQKKKESQATAPKAASKSSKARAKAAKASESLPAKGSSKAATFRVVMPADPSTSTAENQIMSPVGNSTPTPIVPTSQTSGPPAPKIRRVKLIVRDTGSSTSRPTPATPSPLPLLPVPGRSSSTSTPPGSTNTLDVPTAGPIPPSPTAIGPSQLREGVSPCLPQEPVEGSSGSVNPPSVGQQAAEGSTQVEKSKKNWRRPKKMNISTIKFHALGHYPATIRFFGPSDLYSTEWGESFHKSPKAWFKSTSKRFVRKELSMHERKRARLKKAKQRILSKTKADHLAEQRSAARNPDIHHYIGKATHAPVYLLQFSQDGPLSRDIASLSFVRNLKKHLFRRFLCDMAPGLEAQDIEDLHEMYDWSKITFNHDRLYTHRIMRIKYTTYDARRNEDIIHLDTDQCNVMLLNPAYTYGGSHHPFLYGKVIAVLHADVGYIGDIGGRGTEYVYRRMELLWVRWYRVEPKEFMLDEAELLPIDAPDAHAFVDPSSVLRASHIVPKFSEGLRYTGGEGKSAIANDASDYKKYFVNRFVDRDMFMRYEWGLAVGHEYARSNAVEANNRILATRINVAGSAAPTSTSPSFVQPATCEAATLDSSIHALQTDVPTHDDDHDVSDDERHEVDEEDYVSDPDRDSEDDREEELFGDRGGGW